MKKVLDLLEKNVQWLAVGLGGLYVLWMAYSYLFAPPVSVKLGSDQLSPGSVDKYIAENVAEPLTAKMANQVNINLASPTFVAQFKNEMAYASTPQTGLAFANPMFPVGTTEKIEVGPMQGPRPRGPAVAQLVESLVVPPPATMLEFRVGNSNVDTNPPPPPAQPSDARNDQGVARGPGAGPGPANAGAPQPPDAPVVPVAGGVDKTWVTNTFVINGGEIAKAFQETKVPPQLYETTFLQVELHRQEKLPTGEWGPDTIIKPLSVSQLMPVPAAKSPGRVYTNFLDWAVAHVKQILQPDFFNVLRGDAWAAPGQPIAAPVVDDGEKPKEGEKFDPAKWENATPEELKALTNEQKQQLAKWKADKKKQEQKDKNKGKSSGGGKSGGGKGVGGGGLGGGLGGGGGPRGPDDGGRPGGGPSGDSIRGGLAPSERDPQATPPPTDGQPQQQGAPVIGGAFPIPPGAFDPRQFGEIVGWAHDDTVIPGRIYRYRVVYRIKSPVWNYPNVTKPPTLSETFALTSKDGEWGKEIEVPSLTSFYVVSAQQQKGSASVEVFRSQGGVPHGKKFEVAPGDVIGTIEGEVDFTTGWTMVDARTDLRTGDTYVIIMDPDGRLHRRDINTDRNDPEYIQKKQQVAGTGHGDGRVASGSPGAPAGR